MILKISSVIYMDDPYTQFPLQEVWSNDLRNHPNWSLKEYTHYKDLGYSDSKIKKIWDDKNSIS
jgi:hypothetical protein